MNKQWVKMLICMFFLLVTTGNSAYASGSSTDSVGLGLTVNQDFFVKKVAALILESAEKNDLFPSVMIAQVILATNYGESYLATADVNNLFGLKKGEMQKDNLNGSLEFNDFQSFSSVNEGLTAYIELMNNGLLQETNYYDKVHRSVSKTYDKAADFLSGRYACDEKYGEALKNTIKSLCLTDYDFETTTTKKSDDEMIQRSIVDEARSLIGIPYLWGGESLDGFDCSGLVQYVFRDNNVDLPRVTLDQENCGKEVYLSDLKPGDLLFWGTRGESYHVAIYSGNGYMIMAPEPGDFVKELLVSSFYPDFARRII